MTVMKLHSGAYVDPFDPPASEILIGDIAHALAHQCRFNGHCDVFYSIAQHSVEVARYLKLHGPVMAMYGLLHDASKAYIGDIITPVKSLVPAVRKAENRLLGKIFDRFDLPSPVMPSLVKEADCYMLGLEARCLMGATDTDIIARYDATPPPSEVSLPRPLLPSEALGLFLGEFDHLTEQIKRMRNDAA